MDTTDNYGVNVGYRLKRQTRVGVGLSYWTRDSTGLDFRNYNGPPLRPDDGPRVLAVKKHTSRTLRTTLPARALACILATWSAAVVAQSPPADYVVGPQDVLTVQVFDQPDLGGKYTVETDGTFSFPLIGRVTAGGLTLRKVESELKKQLADGYFTNPQVTVAVEQYRSRRVFVMGEVRSPGPVSLTGDMTLIEALARAGSTLPSASGEIAIVRPAQGTNGPIAPNRRERGGHPPRQDPRSRERPSQPEHRAAGWRHDLRAARRERLRLRRGQVSRGLHHPERHDGAAGALACRRGQRGWRDEPHQDRAAGQRRQERGESRAWAIRSSQATPS